MTHLFVPTFPSTTKPLDLWKFLDALYVFVPNFPSTVPGEYPLYFNKYCSAYTLDPECPFTVNGQLPLYALGWGRYGSIPIPVFFACVQLYLGVGDVKHPIHRMDFPFYFFSIGYSHTRFHEQVAHKGIAFH